MSAEREQARRELLAKLDASKTQSERNRLGQFATPFELAREIIRRAVALLPSSAGIRFLEPGLGTGTFYSALMNSPFAERVQAAHGIEIDPCYAAAAERLWRASGLRVTIGDFTKARPPDSQEGKFNLVVCNPPYVRHHHLSRAQKKELQSTVARCTGLEPTGLSGLYTYFMLLSHRWMSAGGVGAWLVPSEFMDVNYGRTVKQFLLEKVTLHEIHRCDPEKVQFDDALVSSAIVFFTNTPPPKNHTIRFSLGGSLSKPRQAEAVNAESLRGVRKWTAAPENRVVPSSHGSEETLADLFTIKRGLATGCNRFFILTPEQVEQNDIPRQFLIPILPSPKDLDTNEVVADRDGIPRIKKRRFLLSCNLPEKEVRSSYRSLWRYLETGVAEGVHERYLCRHRQPWYSQEVRPPAPLLCTYMGRRREKRDGPFRFILNLSKATAPNVYLMLYPREPLASLLKRKPSLLKRLWRTLSAVTEEMLVGKGRVYGGGLHKIEPKELGSVPAATILKMLSGKTEFMTRKQLCLFKR